MRRLKIIGLLVSVMVIVAVALSCLYVSSVSAAEPETCDGVLDHCGGFYYHASDGNYYTVSGLKTISSDLEANGKKSRYYDVFASGKGSGVVRYDKYFSSEVRLLGLLHDDKADGTGKAGLSFFMFFDGGYKENDAWRDSRNRMEFNSEFYWNRFPDAFRLGIVPVVKITRGVPTIDKLWYLSKIEDGRSNEGYKTYGLSGYGYAFPYQEFGWRDDMSMNGMLVGFCL